MPQTACLSPPSLFYYRVLIVTIAPIIFSYLYLIIFGLSKDIVLFAPSGLCLAYHCGLDFYLVLTGYLAVFVKHKCCEGDWPVFIKYILYFTRTFPIRGFQIYDGPIHLTKSTFKKYMPTPDRYSSAIGFLMKNSWQTTPRNNVSLVKFGPQVSVFAWLRHRDLSGGGEDHAPTDKVQPGWGRARPRSHRQGPSIGHAPSLNDRKKGVYSYNC